MKTKNRNNFCNMNW